MLLTNTSRYSDHEVRALVEFGMAETNHSGLAVRVRNSQRAYRGRAYDGVPPLSPLASDPSVVRLVTLGLGAPDHFPCSTAMTSARWLRLPPEIDPRSLPRGHVRRTRRKGARYEFERRVVRTHGYGGVRAPIVEYRDWQEALVAVAAHEARHIWQYQHERPRSEVAAEVYGSGRLAQFRTERSDISTRVEVRAVPLRRASARGSPPGPRGG